MKNFWFLQFILWSLGKISVLCSYRVVIRVYIFPIVPGFADNRKVLFLQLKHLSNFIHSCWINCLFALVLGTGAENLRFIRFIAFCLIIIKVLWFFSEREIAFVTTFLIFGIGVFGNISRLGFVYRVGSC